MPGGGTVSTSIIRFAKSTSAVESGFIAAGVTVSTIAAIQSLAVVMNWIIFGI
jgi:hypothetical protein